MVAIVLEILFLFMYFLWTVEFWLCCYELKTGEDHFVCQAVSLKGPGCLADSWANLIQLESGTEFSCADHSSHWVIDYICHLFPEEFNIQENQMYVQCPGPIYQIRKAP